MLKNLAFDTYGETDQALQARHVLLGRACSRPENAYDLLVLCQIEMQILPEGARVQNVILEIDNGYATIIYKLPESVSFTK